MPWSVATSTAPLARHLPETAARIVEDPSGPVSVARSSPRASTRCATWTTRPACSLAAEKSAWLLDAARAADEARLEDRSGKGSARVAIEDAREERERVVVEHLEPERGVRELHVAASDVNNRTASAYPSDSFESAAVCARSTP